MCPHGPATAAIQVLIISFTFFEYKCSHTRQTVDPRLLEDTEAAAGAVTYLMRGGSTD